MFAINIAKNVNFLCVHIAFLNTYGLISRKITQKISPKNHILILTTAY